MQKRFAKSRIYIVVRDGRARAMRNNVQRTCVCVCEWECLGPVTRNVFIVVCMYNCSRIEHTELY